MRLAAALLLALLLPVQGVAAACAQICAQLDAGHPVESVAAADSVAHGSHDSEGPCHDPEMVAGKCCNAHAFLIDLPVATVAASPAFFERDFSVARWSNFIPEEPSPPPIPAAIA